MLKETKSSRRDMFSALAWAGEVDLGGTRDSSFVATNTDRLVFFEVGRFHCFVLFLISSMLLSQGNNR